MKRLLNYFKPNIVLANKVEEKKLELLIGIILFMVATCTFIFPISLIISSVQEITSMFAITCFGVLALFLVKKGKSYKAIAASVIVFLTVVNSITHLMYAQHPWVVAIWYLFYGKLGYYLYSNKFGIKLLIYGILYTALIYFLNAFDKIPHELTSIVKDSDIETSALISLVFMMMSSFLIFRYFGKIQNNVESDLKASINQLRVKTDELEEINKGMADSLDEKQRIYVIQYRLRKVESLRRRVLEAVNHKQTLEETTQMVVNIIPEYDETKIGAIFWLADKKFKKGPSIGIPEKYMDAIDGLDYAETVGACGPAIKTKNPFFITEVKNHRNYEGFEEFVNEVGIVSSWSYPIFDTNSNVIGTFVLYGKEVNKPSFDEKSFMEEMSSLVTMIISSSQTEKITKEKEVAEKSLQFKTDFLAQMSHEIRTPLNGIIGMVDILFNNTKLDDTQNSYITTIKESSTDLMMIINDVLDISKLEAGKMQILKNTGNLKLSLEKSVSLYSAKAEEKQLELSLEFDNEINQSHKFDSQRLRQVINNLISNAIKFTNKGTVKVKAELIDDFNERQEIRVSVIDSGTGISDEDQQKLFSKYTQLVANTNKSYDGSIKGTGLGLSISQQLIGLMGAELQLSSKVGEGSEFYFTLDIDKAKDNVPSTLKSNKSSKNLGLKVLIAEDKIVNQKVAGLMLKSMNCEVEYANNGEECIEMVKEKPAYFDLILMDIQMPVMDGITATKILKTDFKNIPPIIGLSANNMEGDAEKYMSLGLDDYISKPIETDILFEKLNTYFNNRT